MNVPFLDLSRTVARERPGIDHAMERVLASGTFVGGDEVAAFEREFALFCGARHCVGVGSGLDALALVLNAWGIGPGDEVLVPAQTAVATWMAVSAVGATPVGVDVDPATLNMRTEEAERAVGPLTRAVVPVHFAGHPAEMDELAAIAARHRLHLLEDAAQAHGARRHGRRTGSLADAAAFSFYPTKNLGALGDGGAVVTDDDELADRVALLSNYGWRTKDRPEVLGRNSRLDTLQAAVLRVRLAGLEAQNRRRRALAARYLDGLDGSRLQLPGAEAEVEPAWHLFVVRHPERHAVRAALAENGVGTLIHYPVPPPATAPYAAANGGRAFPAAAEAAAQSLSLPLHAHLDDAEADHVVANVNRVLARFSR